MRLLRKAKASASTPRLIAAAAREVRRADPLGTVIAWVYLLVGATATLGVVATGKLTLDALLRPERATFGSTLSLLLLALTIAVCCALGPLQTQQDRLLGERVSQRVWDRLLDTAARADLVTFESTGFASSLERVRQHALRMPFTATASLLGLTGGLLGVATLSAVLVSVEPLLLPIVLAAGLPAVLLSRWAGRQEFPFTHRLTPLARRRDYLRQLLTERPYAAELRAFDSTGRLGDKQEDLNDDINTGLFGEFRHRRLVAAITTVGVTVALGGALLSIVELLRRGRIGLPEAGAAVIAARLLVGRLDTLVTGIGGLVESAPLFAELDRFVASVPATTPTGRKRTLTEGIALSDVTFSYPGQDRPAVDGVDIRVGAGEVVALVGENGAGKTTLAKIAAGLYAPDTGSRRWDGSVVPAADVRASVTVIFQDFVRYRLTLRDNIVISDGHRGADEDHDVEEAAKRAGLSGVTRELPEGLETMLDGQLGREGVDLSAGQWQRVVLARALYRDTGLLVLDEPAASLDPRSEYELFADVRAMLGGRAALLISHRFSSTRLADRIYVLDAGRVVECGTHDELMARAGQYAELFKLQSAAYR
ncbi:ABC transporter ATP-binding protein [Prauserella cavernicola]|uniref:ABC transporter ATP-binding protein n=1 Tax=Prauserella cavernicola TaxID=2800127 RepID=A0A934QQB8_9PSEU|nr:ABC transporter ATP-binding protein [Prauserella cavernicola]MBK1784128.1 ABC transporter ATP-binding protein [Prauserella cavernicola]